MTPFKKLFLGSLFFISFHSFSQYETTVAEAFKPIEFDASQKQNKASSSSTSPESGAHEDEINVVAESSNEINTFPIPLRICSSLFPKVLGFEVNDDNQAWAVSTRGRSTLFFK